jgi:hypothetical protein
MTRPSRQHAVAFAALSVVLVLSLSAGMGGVGALAGSNPFYAQMPTRTEETATLAELVESLHDAARVLTGLSVALVERPIVPRLTLSDSPRWSPVTGLLVRDLSPPLREAELNLPPPVLG